MTTGEWTPITLTRNEFARMINDDICMSQDVEEDLQKLIEDAKAKGEIGQYKYIHFYNSMTDVGRLLHIARRILYGIVDELIERDEEIE